MHYSDLQLRALSQELIKVGFFFYQISFVWGCTPGIRNRGGTLFYFLVDGSIWTPMQLYGNLRETWHPANQAEVLYLKNRLDAHFSVYSKEIPSWEGIDARHVLLNSERVVAMAG